MVWYDDFEKRLKRIFDEMNRLFEEAFASIPGVKLGFFEGLGRGGVQMEETEKGYIIRVPLAGVRKEDIDLRVVDKTLIISAESKEEKKEEGEEFGKFLYSGYKYYYRVRLPDDADIENIMAKYHNGMLVIGIPKKVEEKKGKKIEIE